jgi:hypothetical protein
VLHPIAGKPMLHLLARRGWCGSARRCRGGRDQLEGAHGRGVEPPAAERKALATPSKWPKKRFWLQWSSDPYGDTPFVTKGR